MRKFLLALFFIVLLIALFYKSPFSALYNYNKAKALYESQQYDKAIPYFERSLFADPKGLLARFYYVLALSNTKPTYSVQKKLYEVANSKIDDEATKYAKAQALGLRYRLLEGIENNFIYNAAMGNDILRWDIKSFPLKVYIEKGVNIPAYYYTEIDYALNKWTNRTNFVKFTNTDKESDADIAIKFKDTPSDLCTENVCKYVAAYTEPQISNDKLLTQMVLTFYKTNPFGNVFTQSEISNTAMHELGHTLGIMGHSDNPADVMFASKDSTINANFLSSYARELSLRDLRTLVLLYRIKPTISDVKNLHSEQFYYAPLILGNDDIRLQKKLNEFKDYIVKYPNISSGYINLASVYADLGDFQSALSNLSIAEKLATNNDELFIINYNKAVVYFNQQAYENALKFANVAKSIDSSKNIDDFINEINQFLN